MVVLQICQVRVLHSHYFNKKTTNFVVELWAVINILQTILKKRENFDVAFDQANYIL